MQKPDNASKHNAQSQQGVLTLNDLETALKSLVEAELECEQTTMIERFSASAAPASTTLDSAATALAVPSTTELNPKTMLAIRFEASDSERLIICFGHRAKLWPMLNKADDYRLTDEVKNGFATTLKTHLSEQAMATVQEWIIDCPYNMKNYVTICELTVARIHKEISQTLGIEYEDMKFHWGEEVVDRLFSDAKDELKRPVHDHYFMTVTCTRQERLRLKAYFSKRDASFSFESIDALPEHKITNIDDEDEFNFYYPTAFPVRWVDDFVELVKTSSGDDDLKKAIQAYRQKYGLLPYESEHTNDESNNVEPLQDEKIKGNNGKTDHQKPETDRQNRGLGQASAELNQNSLGFGQVSNETDQSNAYANQASPNSQQKEVKLLNTKTDLKKKIEELEQRKTDLEQELLHMNRIKEWMGQSVSKSNKERPSSSQANSPNLTKAQESSESAYKNLSECPSGVVNLTTHATHSLPSEPSPSNQFHPRDYDFESMLVINFEHGESVRVYLCLGNQRKLLKVLNQENEIMDEVKDAVKEKLSCRISKAASDSQVWRVCKRKLPELIVQETPALKKIRQILTIVEQRNIDKFDQNYPRLSWEQYKACCELDLTYYYCSITCSPDDVLVLEQTSPGLSKKTITHTDGSIQNITWEKETEYCAKKLEGKQAIKLFAIGFHNGFFSQDRTAANQVSVSEHRCQ